MQAMPPAARPHPILLLTGIDELRLGRSEAACQRQSHSGEGGASHVGVNPKRGIELDDGNW